MIQGILLTELLCFVPSVVVYFDSSGYAVYNKTNSRVGSKFEKNRFTQHVFSNFCLIMSGTQGDSY